MTKRCFWQEIIFGLLEMPEKCLQGGQYFSLFLEDAKQIKMGFFSRFWHLYSANQEDRI